VNPARTIQDKYGRCARFAIAISNLVTIKQQCEILASFPHETRRVTVFKNIDRENFDIIAKLKTKTPQVWH